MGYGRWSMAFSAESERGEMKAFRKWLFKLIFNLTNRAIDLTWESGFDPGFGPWRRLEIGLAAPVFLRRMRCKHPRATHLDTGTYCGECDTSLYLNPDATTAEASAA